MTYSLFLGPFLIDAFGHGTLDEGLQRPTWVISRVVEYVERVNGSVVSGSRDATIVRRASITHTGECGHRTSRPQVHE